MQAKTHFPIQEIIEKLKKNDANLTELSLVTLLADPIPDLYEPGAFINVYTDKHLKALADALLVNTTLKKLEIKEMDENHHPAWTEAGARLFGAAIKNHPALEYVGIHGGSLFCAGIPVKLIMGLLECLTGTAPIKTLFCDFADSAEFTESMGLILKQNRSLENINLCGDSFDNKNVNYKALEVFFDGLFYKKNLNLLTLRWIYAGDHGVQQLSTKLIQQSSLQSLSLLNAGLTTASLSGLMTAIASYCTNIEKIDLGGNRLLSSIDGLVKQLPRLNRLRSLGLSEAKLDFEKAQHLFEYLKNPSCSIKDLDISSNRYQNQSLLFAVLKTLISGNKTLESLKLDYLGLGDVFIKEFGKLLSNPKQCFLTHLSFKDHKVGLDIKSEITLLNILEKNRGIISLTIPVGKLQERLTNAMEYNRKKYSQALFINACINLAQIYYAQDSKTLSTVPADIILTIMMIMGKNTTDMNDADVAACSSLIFSNFTVRKSLKDNSSGKVSADDWWFKSLKGKSIFKAATEPAVAADKVTLMEDCTVM